MYKTNQNVKKINIFTILSMCNICIICTVYHEKPYLEYVQGKIKRTKLQQNYDDTNVKESQYIQGSYEKSYMTLFNAKQYVLNKQKRGNKNQQKYLMMQTKNQSEYIQ